MKHTLLDRARSIMRRNAASKAALAIIPLAAAALPSKASTFLTDPVSFGSIFRPVGISSGGTPPPPPPPKQKAKVYPPLFIPPPKVFHPPFERPGLGGAPFNISLGTADLHTDTLEERMQLIHDAAEEVNSVALGGSDPIAAYNKDSKDVKSTPPEEKFSFFAAGSGLFENIRGAGGDPGYHTTTAGVTTGIDYRITPHLVLGVMGGYEGTDASLVHGGRLSVDTGRGGVYGMWYDGPWYVNLVALGGGSYYDGHFGIHGSPSASPSGSEADSALRVGYDTHVGKWTVGPTVELRYDHVEIDGFNVKTPAGIDRFSQSDANSLRTRIGGRATTIFRIGSVTLRPEFQIAWQHEYLDRDQSLDGYAPDGSHLTDGGVRIGRDSLLIHAGATAPLTDRWSLFLYYMGDLARDNYTSHTVTGGFNYKF